MSANDVAKVSISIDAGTAQVWKALIEPEAIRHYMMGADVVSDWRRGSSIVWKGEYKGKSYEDKGEILEIETGKLLKYSHFSPLSGMEDRPENYHTVTISLRGGDKATDVSLTQDKNATDKAREASEKNWKVMLDGLKKYVEEKA